MRRSSSPVISAEKKNRKPPPTRVAARPDLPAVGPPLQSRRCVNHHRSVRHRAARHRCRRIICADQALKTVRQYVLYRLAADAIRIQQQDRNRNSQLTLLLARRGFSTHGTSALQLLGSQTVVTGSICESGADRKGLDLLS